MVLPNLYSPLDLLDPLLIHYSLNKGTSNSAACVVNTAGDPVIIKSPEGSRTIPSVVSVDAQGKLQVGLTAKQQASINPHSTFFSTKRVIGRKFTDHDVINDVRNFPFNIVAHENGEAWIEAYGRRYSPSYIASRIIRKLVENAELQLNTSFPKAVIAIPAYFNTLQRSGYSGCRPRGRSRCSFGNRANCSCSGLRPAPLR